MLRKLIERVKDTYVTVEPVRAWYDLWTGFYWNRKRKTLYFLPVPTLGVKIQFWSRKQNRENWEFFNKNVQRGYCEGQFLAIKVTEEGETDVFVERPIGEEEN